jgi:hypothetical protein
MFRPSVDIRGYNIYKIIFIMCHTCPFYNVSQGLSNVTTEYSLKDWLLKINYVAQL